MLDSLITSKTRIKLLLKFFLNSSTKSYLRDLESEFGESTNAIRLELNRFEKAGLLHSEVSGNKKLFCANTLHPLFKDIHNILLKYTGIDQVIERVIEKMGGLEQTWLLGDLAKGKQSPIIDLLFVGTGLDKSFLLNLTEKAEKLTGRKIRYMIADPQEASALLQKTPGALLLWKQT